MSLELAIKKCREIPFKKDQRRIYSIVVDKKGRIVGESANNYCKSHPLQAYYAKKAGMCERVYLHSEVASLLKAKGKGVKIYIARVDSKGNAVPASPCPVCQIALKEAGIKSVEFSL